MSTPATAPRALPPPSPDTPTSRPTAPGRRLGGVDMARALAIVGMVMMHVARGGTDPSAFPYGLADGRASTLFAVVAGVGASLLARRRTLPAVRSRLLYRSVWLLPLGLWLQRLDGHGVAVILQHYAVWFALTALVIGWSSRALVALTGVGVLVGPGVLVLAQRLRPAWYEPPGLTDGTEHLVRDLLVSGYYPTVSWWWVVLAGVLVGRLDLRRPAIALRLLLGGGAVATVTYLGAAALRGVAAPDGVWQAVLATEGHADTPTEVVAATAAVVAVLGLCLLLAAALPAVLRHPWIAFGRLALTVYVAHLLVFDASPPLLASQTLGEAVATTATVALVSAVFATAWLALLPRGPLEGAERWGYERLVRPLLPPGWTAPPPPPPDEPLA